MNEVPEDTQAPEPRSAVRRWKTVALGAAGGLIIAAATAIVTLAATHNSAVTENGKAYVNGWTDGYRDGFDDGSLCY